MPHPSHSDRLLAQAEAWRQATAAVLDEIGVAAGWRCADLGCGPLGILDLLSRRVGRRGAVVGVDRDPAILVSCLDRMGARRPPNVSLVLADATRTGLPGESFDLVHARLLAQATGAGPLVAEMTRLVRPGGIVLLEEPGPELWEIEPAPRGYRDLAPRVAGAMLPRRRSAGPSLPGVFRRAGLAGIESRQVRLDLRGGAPYARMPLFALTAARKTSPAIAWPGAAALRRLASELEAAALDPAVRHRSFPLWQVWGTRPGSQGPKVPD